MVQPLESLLYLLTVLDACSSISISAAFYGLCQIANAVFNQTLFRYQPASMLLYIAGKIPLAAKTVAIH
jgi:hypothetical protein